MAQDEEISDSVIFGNTANEDDSVASSMNFHIITDSTISSNAETGCDTSDLEGVHITVAHTDHGNRIAEIVISQGVAMEDVVEISEMEHVLTTHQKGAHTNALAWLILWLMWRLWKCLK